jgi:hypothetical protein
MQRTGLCVPTLPTPLLARVLLPLVERASARDAEALEALAAARRVCREWRDAANLALRSLTALAPRDALALVLALSGRLPALRTLCLSRCCRNAPPGLLACAPFAQLTALDLSDCMWVTPKKLAKLAARLPSLTSLTLSRCASPKLQACGAAAGAALLPLAAQLRSLSLERSAFPPASLLRLAPRLAVLEELCLAGCIHLHATPGSDHAVAGALAALAPHRALRRLDVSSCDDLLYDDGDAVGPLWGVLPAFAGVLTHLDVSDCGMHGRDIALRAALTPPAAAGGGENVTCVTQEWECVTVPDKLCAWPAMVRRFDELSSWMHSPDTDDSVGVALLGGTRGFVLAQLHVAARRRRGFAWGGGAAPPATEPNALVLLPLARALAGPLHTRWEACGEAQTLPTPPAWTLGTALEIVLMHAARVISDAGDAAPRRFFELSEPRACDPRVGDGAAQGRLLPDWPYRAAEDEIVPLLLSLARAAETLDAPVVLSEEEAAAAAAAAADAQEAGVEEPPLPLRTAWLDCVAVPPGGAEPCGGACAVARRAPLDALPSPPWLRPGALCAAWGRDCAGCRAWRRAA